MERARDRLERILGIRELARLDDPRPFGRRQEKPVVGADEEPALGVGERERSPDPPTPGSTTARWTPTGM